MSTKPAQLTAPVLEWLYAEGHISLEVCQLLRDTPTRARGRQATMVTCGWCGAVMAKQRQRRHRCPGRTDAIRALVAEIKSDLEAQAERLQS